MSTKFKQETLKHETEQKERMARRQRRNAIQNYKTLFLAVLTIVIFIGACLFSLDIPQQTIISYLTASVLMVALMIGAALLLFLLIKTVKKHFK